MSPADLSTLMGSERPCSPHPTDDRDALEAAGC